MNTDVHATQPGEATEPEASRRPQLSNRARDAGDRVCCGVLIAAVAAAVLLGWAWVVALPAFR
jgi:hypothetical protein